LHRVFLTFFLAERTVKRIDKKEPEKKDIINRLKMASLDAKGRKNEHDELSPTKSSIPLWIDYQYIKEEDLDTIRNATNISKAMLDTKLLKESFARIDYLDEIPTIFLWDSRIRHDSQGSDTLDVATNDMLIVCSGNDIITLSSGESHLFDKVSDEISNNFNVLKYSFADNEFPVKILYFLLRQKIADYSEIIRRIEKKTIEFEEIPLDKTSPQFLEKTFHFKKEIQKISSNLWHFHKVLHQLIEKRNLELLKINNSIEFEILHSESDYLYETSKNIRESLISLIELHINTVSYDMNRVMKVIAVITCLAIIPSTVGGLLGVNLEEGNFHIKLIEIFFIVFSSMILGLYTFYKMEWLK
jgi:Mg2+ and Co2+ transporter CorA